MLSAAPIAEIRAAAVPNQDFVAFLSDDNSRQAAGEVASLLGWPATSVQHGGIESAIEAMPGLTAARLIVADIDEAADPVQALGRLIAQTPASCRIIALGTTNDVRLFRSLVEAGAADYLVKPLAPEVLRRAVEEALRPPDAPAAANAKLGRLTVVVGTRGGVGASTIAVNLAWMMAHEHKLNTALLDLDLHFGTSALALDLEPGRGLREALQTPDRLDSLLIASSMTSESERLCVLATEEPVEEAIPFDTNALIGLIDELRRTFANVVVEMPRALLPLHRRALAMADDVILVSDLSLAGIRDTARIVGPIEALAGDRRLLIVAGRVGGDRKTQIDRATFERGIGGKLAALVPEDAKAVRAGANVGKALGSVARNAPVTRALRDLAARLCAGEEKSKSGLLGWFRKTAS